MKLDLRACQSLFFHLCEVFQSKAQELNKLDSAIGDGDHGDTMARAFKAASLAAQNGYTSISALFKAVADHLAEETGGAIGPLLAAFFAEGGLVFKDLEVIETADLTDFFQLGYQAVRQVGGAHPGDKTMLDALEPAVQALKDSSSQTLQVALGKAHRASQAGADATRDLQAVHGRARFLGHRSLGHPDPGAVSFSYIIGGFAAVAGGLRLSPPETERIKPPVFHPKGKFLNDPEDMVTQDNLGLSLAYPKLVRLTHEGILVRTHPKADGKVALVIGHGGGHTPSMGGFIGTGLLDADVYGPLFTCASGLRIARAIELSQHGGGIALLVSNHAGDVLNARLAQRWAEQAGIKVEFILLSDDIATAPREQYLNRRGLGGLLFALKVGGGAAEAGLSLVDVAALMRETNQHTATLSVASRPPTHPINGEPLFDLPDGQIEVGTGVHGEVGVYRGELLPADTLIEMMLKKLVADLADLIDGPVLVFLNGSGGTSTMELHILYQSALRQLEGHGIKVASGVVGSFFTTFEMCGFSLSLCALDPSAQPWWDAPAIGPNFVWPHHT